MEKENFKINHSLLNYLGIAILVLLIVLIAFVFAATKNKIRQGRYIGQNIEAKNTITVSGEGEIYSKPDLALVNISVKTEKKNVSDALNENASKMNKIIKVIEGVGVEKKDLQTTDFNIYPRYEYIKSSNATEGQIYPYGKRTLVGYEIGQTLEVKIRDLSKIGKILRQATDAGANQVGDIGFTIEDKDALQEKAREEAIDKAKIKAKELASQLGVTLGRIVSFSENTGSPIYYRMKNAMPSSGANGTTPQIEAGENKIKVDVSVVYEIH